MSAPRVKAVVLLAVLVSLASCGTLAGRSQRAVVAIRDDVTPFQKWGTRAFTKPQLAWTYDRVVYLTEGDDDHVQQRFVDGLTECLQAYPDVDLFLLAHSNHYHRWVAQVDPSLRSHLRMVYNTGCYDARQSDTWLQLGARTYVGHPGDSDSPVFYFFFLGKWLWGHDADRAVRAANGDARFIFGVASVLHLGHVDKHTADDSVAQLFGAPDAHIVGDSAPTAIPPAENCGTRTDP